MATPLSREALRLGLVALIFSLALLGLRFAIVQPPAGEAVPGDRAFVTLYDPPRTKTDTMIDVGDGQAWAALGQDPTFVHPERFYEGTTEFVYRSARPGFGWMVWAVSLGQPALVPAAMMMLTALGVALMVAVAAALAAMDGRQPKVALLALALPGTMLVNISFGPEALAFGLAMLGVIFWTGPPRRRWLAVGMFVAAVLTRDVAMVIPAVLGLWQLLVRRDRFRDLLALALPLVFYGGWVFSLHARFGYWPNQAHKYERVASPFVGFGHALSEGLPTLTLFSIALGTVLMITALVRRRDSLLTWLAAGFLIPAVFFGGNVWVSECYRVLLPLYVLCLVVVSPIDPKGKATSELRSRNGLTG